MASHAAGLIDGAATASEEAAPPTVETAAPTAPESDGEAQAEDAAALELAALDETDAGEAGDGLDGAEFDEGALRALAQEASRRGKADGPT